MIVVARSILISAAIIPLSGCWKYNVSKLHSNLTPAQLCERLSPGVQIGVPREQAVDVLDKYYVSRLEDGQSLEGESAVVYRLRPPGWSYRGPFLKGSEFFVGKQYFFVFDSSDHLIAVSDRTSVYPSDVKVGHFMTAMPRRNR